VSERNVELTRHVVEAFNARDIEAMIAYCDPSGEFHSTHAAVGGVYHGHDGMRSWQRDFEDAWGEEIRLEPVAYSDLCQDTLLFHVLHGRGRQSGVKVAMPIVTVFKWRDDLLVRAKGYVEREDALRDLGVSDTELEPIDP
jgi:hypothetical protein